MSKPSYTDAFRRLLVDEALNRTPTGGFPELEKRHGLKPGTLFDWVEELGGEIGAGLSSAPFSALHVWIGTTGASEAEFARYLGHDPAYWQADEERRETAAEDLTGCGFCRDLGLRYLYDEDLMLAVHLPAAVPVGEMIDEGALRTDEAGAAMLAECAARGITVANAMMVYGDADLTVADRNKLYNGLIYLGRFADQ